MVCQAKCVLRDGGSCVKRRRKIYIFALQDISKWKQTEEELRGSEKRSRAWLEHSPVCTKIVDLDFNLQFMSSSGIKDLKIDDITAYYGKPYPLDFYPDSFRHSMGKRLEKAKKTGEIITHEAPIVDIEGNDLWYHSTIVPVHGEEGEIDYIKDSPLRENLNSVFEGAMRAKDLVKQNDKQ